MPKKEKKPRFVITRRIYPTEWQKHKIDKEMDAANFLYNMGVRYYGATLEVLMSDPDFEGLLNRYGKWHKDNPDSEKENPYQKEISAWMEELQLNEYDLHHWFVQTSNRKAISPATSAWPTLRKRTYKPQSGGSYAPLR